MGFLSGLMDKFKGASKTPAAFLAAFGKHPGWNDHMDDQGLESPLLIDFRRFFYVQGMCGVIDSGAWESLSPDQRLDSFNHLLLCKRGSSLLLARFWSSSDGKGRKKYPFVALAQSDNLPASWLVQTASPLLENIQNKANATQSSTDIIETLDASRALLRKELPQAAPPPLSNPGFLKNLSAHPEMGLSNFRILLYHTQREFTSFLKGTPQSKTAIPRQMRVPRCAETPLASLLLWSQYLDLFIDDSVLTLVIAPIDQPFVDLLAAEPTPALLSCIRSSLSQIPLSTGIPYNLDPEFVAFADRMMA